MVGKAGSDQYQEPTPYRVADLAGNVTTTNFTVILDYSAATNAPEVAVVWPLPGVHLSGDSFYIRGRINDETASVIAQQVDGAGGTNVIAGIVERNGRFWVEGLPLSAGTNEWELVATDAAGNVTVTNVTVVRSEVVITITSTPTGELLYEPAGTVSGTISDQDYTVMVNGVEAEVDEYGSWYAENVPNNGPGTATFDVVAEPSGGGGSGGGSSGDGATVYFSQAVELPAVVKITRHLINLTQNTWSSSSTWTKQYDATYAPDTEVNWKPKYEGAASMYVTDSVYGNSMTRYQWSEVDPVGTQETETMWGNYGPWPMTSEDWLVRKIPHQSFDHEISGSTMGYEVFYVPHYFAKGVRHTFPGWNGTEQVVTVVARTLETLIPGARSELARAALLRLVSQPTEYGKPQNHPWSYTPWYPVDSERVTIAGKPAGPDYSVYVKVAAGAPVQIRTTVAGAKHFNTSAWATELKLVHQTVCVALTDTNLARLNLGVGEYAGLGLDGGAYHWWDVPTWTTTAGGLLSPVGWLNQLTAPSNAANATVKVKVRDEELEVKFKVVEPENETAVKVPPDDVIALPLYGAGMKLNITVHPTDVSFYRVEMTEVAGPATDIDGLFNFVDEADLYHWPGGPGSGPATTNWYPLTEFNQCSDRARFDVSGFTPAQIHAGTFKNVIPMRWRVSGAANENPFPSRVQVHQLVDSSGNAIISKLSCSATNTP